MQKWTTLGYKNSPCNDLGQIYSHCYTFIRTSSPIQCDQIWWNFTTNLSLGQIFLSLFSTGQNIESILTKMFWYLANFHCCKCLKIFTLIPWYFLKWEWSLVWHQNWFIKSCRSFGKLIFEIFVQNWEF